MKTLRKILNNRKGQAAIETGFALSFLIWLLYYTVNAYHAMHTAHIGQKYSAMSLYQRLDNRAKFVIDGVEEQLHGQEFMGVQYTTPSGNVPRRRIVVRIQNNEICEHFGKKDRGVIQDCYNSRKE